MNDINDVLSDIGEYGLHNILSSLLTKSPLDKAGIGDDCSMISLGDSKTLLLSVDKAAQSAFERSAYYVGQLCAVQNFSDVICKGGMPVGILLGIFLPRDAQVKYYKDIILGAQNIAHRYGAHVIGGDTKESSKAMVTGFGVGIVENREPIMRKGAKPGDCLAITLKKGKKIGIPWCYYLIDKLKLPIAMEKKEFFERRYYEDNIILPYSETQAAISHGKIRASSDTSDGIGGATRLITENFGLGALFYLDSLYKIIDPSVKEVASIIGVEIERFAFSPGFVWENVFAIDPEHFENTKIAVDKSGGKLIQIGEVTDTVGMNILSNKGARAIRNIYNENFKDNDWLSRLDQNWINGDFYIT